MQVQDLGELEGPVVLFGGPVFKSSCALEALLALGHFAPDRMISTGDLVAYCADASCRCGSCVRALGMAGCCGQLRESSWARARPIAGADFEEGTVCDALADGLVPPCPEGRWTKMRGDWLAAAAGSALCSAMAASATG